MDTKDAKPETSTPSKIILLKDQKRLAGITIIMDTKDITAIGLDDLLSKGTIPQTSLFENGEISKFYNWCIERKLIDNRCIKNIKLILNKVLPSKCELCPCKKVVEIWSDGKKYYFVCGMCQIPKDWSSVFECFTIETSSAGTYKECWFIRCIFIFQQLLECGDTLESVINILR